MQASSQGAAAVANSVDSNAVGNLKLTLPSMTNDDALSFFHAFERTLEINDIHRTKWIKFLPAQLSPKALKAFTSLTLEQSRDYDVAKRSILAYYKLDAHAYLKAFKSQRRTGNETYKMFLNKMSETFSYWQEAKGINSLQSLSDAILAEQFLQSLPDNVRSFVRARQPKSAAECAEYADLCYEVSMMSSSGNPPSKGTNGKGQWPADHNRFGGNGHNARYYKDQRNQPPKFAPPVCARCGKAHNPNKPCKQYGVYATNTFSCENAVIKDPYIVPLFLNGQKVSALRDTGNAGLVLVDKRLVPPEAYIPDTYVFCKGVFDKDIKRKIPLAEVKIRSPRFRFNKDVLVRVGVCELPHGIDCNVGNELFQTHPKLTDIIAFRRDMDTTTGVLDMQDLGEPMTSDDCDTDLHGDQTAATTHTDDTTQMYAYCIACNGKSDQMCV